MKRRMTWAMTCLFAVTSATEVHAANILDLVSVNYSISSRSDYQFFVDGEGVVPLSASQSKSQTFAGIPASLVRTVGPLSVSPPPGPSMTVGQGSGVGKATLSRSATQYAAEVESSASAFAFDGFGASGSAFASVTIQLNLFQDTIVEPYSGSNSESLADVEIVQDGFGTVLYAAPFIPGSSDPFLLEGGYSYTIRLRSEAFATASFSPPRAIAGITIAIPEVSSALLVLVPVSGIVMASACRRYRSGR